MKIEDYEAMLLAVENALEVCDQSAYSMDLTHREMCEDLRAIRARLLALIAAAGPGTT